MPATPLILSVIDMEPEMMDTTVHHPEKEQDASSIVTMGPIVPCGRSVSIGYGICESHFDKPKSFHRVTFAPELVTDIWERPKTRPEEKSRLFYSGQQLRTFRKEYREEKRAIRNAMDNAPFQFWVIKTWEYAAELAKDSINSFLMGLQMSSSSPLVRVSDINIVLVDTLYAF